MLRLPSFIAALVAACVLTTGVSAPALAAPLTYYNQPFDTPNSAVNALVTQLNGAGPGTATVVTCTGTTTATCSGKRIAVSTTGLTTAAGALSAAVTVTNTSVTAASQILCQTNGYAGTGVPNAVLVIPAAGSFTFVIQNSHASAALNATVVTACFVYN